MTLATESIAATSVEELRHGLLHGRVGDALLGLEDERAALAITSLGEVGLHDVEATGALDVGQVELGAVALPDDAGQHDADDHGADPCEDDGSTPAMSTSDQDEQTRSTPGGIGGSRYSWVA